jgi:hypothetical protein
LWEPGLGSLEEKNLKIFKVQAKKNMTVAEFEALLKEKSGLTSMTIIKYHMDYGIEYAEIINSKESKVANLEQMPENQLFFIEEEAPYNE